MPENTVSVTRPGRWGNHFKVGIDGTAVEVVEKFRNHVLQFWNTLIIVDDEQVTVGRNIKNQLKGKNLACFCKVGEPCHGDVLLELANS